jgi:hypothetical protein
MQIPDDIAAELAQALTHARTSIPVAWIKRSGSRFDSAMAYQRVHDLATKAGLLPSRRVQAEVIYLFLPGGTAAEGEKVSQFQLVSAPGEVAGEGTS